MVVGRANARSYRARRYYQWQSSYHLNLIIFAILFPLPATIPALVLNIIEVYIKCGLRSEKNRGLEGMEGRCGSRVFAVLVLAKTSPIFRDNLTATGNTAEADTVKAAKTILGEASAIISPTLDRIMDNHDASARTETQGALRDSIDMYLRSAIFTLFEGEKIGLIQLRVFFDIHLPTLKKISAKARNLSSVKSSSAKLGFF